MTDEDKKVIAMLMSTCVACFLHSGMLLSDVRAFVSMVSKIFRSYKWVAAAESFDRTCKKLVDVAIAESN